MYALYADESGFSKSNQFEKEQPVLVVAGLLIDFTRLRKALDVFDTILMEVNSKLKFPVNELKFSAIRNKHPFIMQLPKIDERADLLENILLTFKQEIDFKIIYSAIDSELYHKTKRNEPVFRNNLTHHYLVAAYHLLAQLEKHQSAKPKNKGKTFVVFDEQEQFQNRLESLVNQPLHVEKFSQIFDTVYFGKSHYSKLVQMADLVAGAIRYYLSRLKAGYTPENDHWIARIDGILEQLAPNIVQANCFNGQLETLYDRIEIRIKKKPRQKSGEALKSQQDSNLPPR